MFSRADPTARNSISDANAAHLRLYLVLFCQAASAQPVTLGEAASADARPGSQTARRSACCCKRRSEWPSPFQDEPFDSPAMRRRITAVMPPLVLESGSGRVLKPAGCGRQRVRRRSQGRRSQAGQRQDIVCVRHCPRPHHLGRAGRCGSCGGAIPADGAAIRLTMPRKLPPPSLGRCRAAISGSKPCPPASAVTGQVATPADADRVMELARAFLTDKQTARKSS